VNLFFNHDYTRYLRDKYITLWWNNSDRTYLHPYASLPCWLIYRWPASPRVTRVNAHRGRVHIWTLSEKLPEIVYKIIQHLIYILYFYVDNLFWALNNIKTSQLSSNLRVMLISSGCARLEYYILVFYIMQAVNETWNIDRVLKKWI
jgi:hypothetical protein